MLSPRTAENDAIPRAKAAHYVNFLFPDCSGYRKQELADSNHNHFNFRRLSFWAVWVPSLSLGATVSFVTALQHWNLFTFYTRSAWALQTTANHRKMNYYQRTAKTVTECKQEGCYTGNRSRVTIRGRTCKIGLTSSLNTMQNLVVVSHTVCAHVGGPTNLGDAGAQPLGMGRGWCHRNTLVPYIYYHTKFCRCRSNRLGVHMGPENWWDDGTRPLGMGTWLTPKTCYPSCVNAPNFVVSEYVPFQK